MRCPWRPLRAGKTRNGRWLARVVFLCFVVGPMLGVVAALPAQAQFAAVAPPPVVPPAPPAPPAPIPPPLMIDQTVAAGAPATHPGSNLLGRPPPTHRPPPQPP